MSRTEPRSRLIWADDQRDVARTVSALLDPLGVDVVFVEDGEAALSAVRNSRIDLMIVDLQMPPGEWGGLWLLAQIEKAGISVPCLVLSGEGGQPETIEALRRGASDYVTKDRVADELLDRVSSLLERTRSIRERDGRELVESLQTSLPLPVALPYRRVSAERDPVGKLRRTVEAFEAAVRFIALVGLAETVAANGTTSATTLNDLRAPSFGDWRMAVIGLRKDGLARSLFDGIAGCVTGAWLQKVVDLRNDLHHGGDPSGRAATAILEELSPRLTETLRRLRAEWQAELLIVESLDYDGASYTVTAALAQGHGSGFALGERATAIPLQKHEVVALQPDGHSVRLRPWIMADDGEAPGTWRLFVFDGLRWKGRTTPTGAEALRYIEITSGRRNLPPPDAGTIADIRSAVE